MHAATLVTPGSHEFDYDDSTETDGLTATGMLTIDGAGVEAQHRLYFQCYAGGHGGFGPSAVDGLVDVTIQAPTGRADTYVVTVLGEARLGGGTALSPSVPALAGYTVLSEDRQRTYTEMLGPFDVSTL
ncbi:MAG: hypothetical protein ACRBN8_45300 [Nannocystales bacterium]